MGLGLSVSPVCHLRIISTSLYSSPEDPSLLTVTDTANHHQVSPRQVCHGNDISNYCRRWCEVMFSAQFSDL